MKEHYVSYSQAVRLKELGFDWEVNHYYHDELEEICDGSTSNYDNCNGTDYIERVCSAPTLAQAQAWLWEKYKLWIEVTIKAKNDFTLCIVDEYGEVKFIGEGKDSIPNTYIAGIDKAIELLTDKTTDK